VLCFMYFFIIFCWFGFCFIFFFFSSRRRHTRWPRDWSSDVCSSDLKGTMNITPWMEWFLGCLGRAIDGAQTALANVLAKARFWRSEERRVGKECRSGWGADH